MALLAEAKRVAAEFDFSDNDVQKTVAEFIAEMSAYSLARQSERRNRLTIAQTRDWRRMRPP
jgi:hypothetical protein